ncbi:MAG: hypothetical protein RLZZ546_2850, partial [Bacteroidota bacterium]
PYDNNILYMGQHNSFSDDTYKICFYPSHIISFDQAKKITRLFCNQDDYTKITSNYDVLNPKYWVNYLTFQTPIASKKEPYVNGEMGGRIIVELYLNKLVAEFRKEKIKKILNETR